MQILFITEASKTTGTGHLRRCSALAHAFNKFWNCKIDLILNHDGADYLIKQNVFTEITLIKSLNSESFDPFLERNIFYDLAVFDSYKIDSSIEQRFKGISRIRLVIDDLANRKHDCEILIDQNNTNDEKTYRQLTPHCPQFLIGSKYAILSDQFALARKSVESKPRTMKNRPLVCFLCYGGSDTLYTENAMSVLKDIDTPLQINVFSGVDNPNLIALSQKAPQHFWSLHFKENQLASHMLEANFAIGAGGTMSHERCCLGLPSIVTIIAENQREVSRSLYDSGCALIHDGRQIGYEKNLKAQIHDLISNDIKLANMSKQAFKLVDGKGIARIVKSLDELLLN